MKKNYLHINYGFGKGKTTAGYGLCLRAYGRGMKSLVIRFLKPVESGEILAINSLVSDGGIEIKNFEPPHGFLKTKEEAVYLSQCVRYALECFKGAVRSKKYGVIFLDEFIDAVNLGLADEEEFLRIYSECECDVVISGRNPSDKFISSADYITEFTSHKHPYDNGIIAREGIEF